MKFRVLLFLLLITSLIGYLEWGKGQHAFLFQTEVDLFTKVFRTPRAVLHPMVLIPLAGQTLLLLAMVLKRFQVAVTYIGMACIGLLLVFLLVIGILSQNWKIFISVLPFFACASIMVKHLWSQHT